MKTLRLTRDDLLSDQPLLDELAKIVQESFIVPSGHAAEHAVLRAPDSRFLVFYEQGTVVGFCSWAVQPCQLNGRSRVVFDLGMYFREGARGRGWKAVAPSFRELIAFKLRSPRTPLCFVGIATSPAMYRLVTRFAPRVQPNRHADPPAEVTALVRHVMAERGFEFVDDDPWRVHLPVPARPRNAERMRRFIERSRNPDVAFYLERNPGHLEGQWMALYSEVTMLGILDRLVAMVSHRLRGSGTTRGRTGTKVESILRRKYERIFEADGTSHRPRAQSKRRDHIGDAQPEERVGRGVLPDSGLSESS